jgi:hypothetical protein
MKETQGKDAVREDKRNRLLRIAFSSVMFLGGALIAVLTEGRAEQLSILAQKCGLAFIIVGIVSLFTEFVLEYLKPEPTHVTLDLLSRPRETGMRMIYSPRKGFWRYHTWLLVNEPQDLFFAGRSVLHRVQEDFRIRRLGPVEDAFLRKLEEGSKIKILFCNPTWDLIPVLAAAEGQRDKALYADLATTLGIVWRLWKKLESQSLPGELDIRMYEEQVQYAYHRTKNLTTGDKEMLLGFYFVQKLGCRSPLFEVDNELIQAEFEDHFVSVFARAFRLFEYPAFGHGKQFDRELFARAKDHLVKQIGADDVVKLVGS